MKQQNQHSIDRSKQLHVKCKRSLSTLFISTIALTILGCSNSTHLLTVIPANLQEPCPDLQKLESGQGKAVMLWSVDTVAKYNDCKARHGAIVKALN